VCLCVCVQNSVLLANLTEHQWCADERQDALNQRRGDKRSSNKKALTEEYVTDTVGDGNHQSLLLLGANKLASTPIIPDPVRNQVVAHDPALISDLQAVNDRLFRVHQMKRGNQAGEEQSMPKRRRQRSSTIAQAPPGKA